MAQRKTKRKFLVQANMRVLELSKAGTSVDFDIFSQGETFGTLVIGRGSVSWRGQNRSRIMPTDDYNDSAATATVQVTIISYSLMLKLSLKKASTSVAFHSGSKVPQCAH